MGDPRLVAQTGDHAPHNLELGGASFRPGDRIRVVHQKKAQTVITGLAIWSTRQGGKPVVGVYSYDPRRGARIQEYSGREKKPVTVEVLTAADEMLRKYGYTRGEIFPGQYDPRGDVTGNLRVVGIVIKKKDAVTVLCIDEAGMYFEQPVPEARQRRRAEH